MSAECNHHLGRKYCDVVNGCNVIVRNYNAIWVRYSEIIHFIGMYKSRKNAVREIGLKTTSISTGSPTMQTDSTSIGHFPCPIALSAISSERKNWRKIKYWRSEWMWMIWGDANSWNTNNANGKQMIKYQIRSQMESAYTQQTEREYKKCAKSWSSLGMPIGFWYNRK